MSAAAAKIPRRVPKKLRSQLRAARAGAAEAGAAGAATAVGAPPVPGAVGPLAGVPGAPGPAGGGPPRLKILPRAVCPASQTSDWKVTHRNPKANDPSAER